MNKDEALKMAIDDLELCNGAQTVEDIIIYTHEAIQACKEALEQPAQEPVAWMSKKRGDVSKAKMYFNEGEEILPLYTHPAPAIEQEPVAWIEVTTHHEKYQTSKVILLDKGIKLPHDTLLYTHPAPSCQECENLKHDLEGYMDANKALINREWQGLEFMELSKIWFEFVMPKDKNGKHKERFGYAGVFIQEIEEFARAIEQALKEKNDKS